MRYLVGPFRFFCMLFILVLFLATMAVVWLVVREHWARVRQSNRILKFFCRLGLKILNVRASYEGLEHVEPGVLLVGNHLSYVDVVVVHARVPACFVTSKEIKQTPVLGQVCQLAGCLFVERRTRMNLRGEVEEIAEGLRRGFNVAIFPEATSTNGEQVLRFKRPLFTAAERAARPVVPFCLNYHTVGGEPINRVTRDKIFWYGDMGFAGHLWALSCSGGVDVRLSFLDKLDAKESANVAEVARERILGVFEPVT